MMTSGLAADPSPQREVNGAPHLTLCGFQPDFAVVADRIVADRLRTWPAKVEREDMDQHTYDRRVGIMRAVAAIWRNAGLFDMRPPKSLFIWSRQDLLGELAATLQAAEDRARRRPNDRAAAVTVDQLQAMRWWFALYAAGDTYIHNLLCGLARDAFQRQQEHAS